MRMCNSSGQRIRCVQCIDPASRKQALHHGKNLLFAGVSDTDDRLLDVVWRVLSDFEAGLRSSKQRDGTGVTEL